MLRLIELKLIDREWRTLKRRIRAARFPAVKSFDTFEFPAIPGLNKMLVLELARREYVLRRENIIALGNSGTGKTHVAFALGLAARQKAFTVAFTTAAALVSRLLEARDRAGRAHPVRARLIRRSRTAMPHRSILNKDEARNALAIFFNRLGELRDRTFANQRHRASGLTLVTAAEHMYLDCAVQHLRSTGVDVPDELLAHVAPLGW